MTDEKPKHDYKSQGRKNRQAGKRFEKKVEEDLESKGWIVMRFAKQVDLVQSKLINPKPHYNPFTKSIGYAGTGFPDFICFKQNDLDNFIIQFIECKVNGSLSPIERDKCEWIQKNLHIPISVASKGEKRGVINYETK